MSNITQKESEFLAKIRGQLKSEDSQQQRIYDLMIEAVEKQFEQSSGDSTLADVAKALQSGIDTYKQSLQNLADQNKASAQREVAKLRKPEGNQEKRDVIAISPGKAELEAQIKPLTDAVTQDKMQSVFNAATASGLMSGEQSLTLDINFTANLVESIDVQQTILKNKMMSGKTKPDNRTVEPRNIKVKGVSIPDTYANATKLHGVTKVDAYSTFVVRGDLDARDGVKTYDTLDGWVDALHQKGGNGTKADIKKWIIRANNLQRVRQKDCDGRYYSSYLFPEGRELAIPPNNDDFSPYQNFLHCSTCEVNVGPLRGTDVNFVPNGGFKFQPGKVIIPPPPPPPVSDQARYFDVRRPSASSLGSEIRQGDVRWNLELMAMSGIDMDFSREFYSLKNAAPNKRLQRKEKRSTSETEGFVLEGRNRGRTELSEMDDESMDKNTYANGKRSRRNDKGRPFVNGYITKVEDDGTLVRKDGTVGAFVHGGDYASERQFGLGIKQHHIPKGVPISFVLFNPSKQISTFGQTARHGLTESRYAMAEVNIGGKHNMFADQHTWMSGFFDSPDRVGNYTVLKYDERYFDTKMAELEAASTLEKKQELATEVLKAWRDIKDNPMMRVVDSHTQGAMVKNQEALHDYLTRVIGVNANTIAKEVEDVSKHPRIVPQVMGDEQYNYLDKNGIRQDRLSGIKVKEINTSYEALVRETFTVQNSIEHQIALGKSKALEEAGAIQMTRETWQTITQKSDGTINTDGIKAYGAFIARDRSAAIETGMALSDMLRNPQNYDMKKEDAETFVKSICGDTDDGKLAFKNVSHLGQTPRIGHDKPFAVSRPDLIGKAVGAVVKENPGLFKQFIDKINREEVKDGRRHAVAMIHALAAEHHFEKSLENKDPQAVADIAKSLPADKVEAFCAAVRDVTAYTESAASGRSVQGVNYIDNKMASAQETARQGTTADLDTLYNDLFTSKDAVESKAHMVAVKSLKAHPALAIDAILATALRDPKMFEKLEKGLDQYGDGIHNKLEEYHTLRKSLKRARKELEQYKRTGKAEDLNDAVQDLGRFFVRLEDNADARKDRIRNNAEQRMNAWQAVVDIVGNDAAMSASVVETIAKNTTMRNDFIKAVPSAVFQDNLRHNHVPSHIEPKMTMSDELHTLMLFSLPHDANGNVKSRKGLFGKTQVTVNQDLVQTFVNPSGTQGGANVLQQTSLNDIITSITDQNQQEQLSSILGENGALQKMRNNASSNPNFAQQLQGANKDAKPAEMLAAALAANDASLGRDSTLLVNTAQRMIDHGMVKIITVDNQTRLIVNPTLKNKAYDPNAIQEQLQTSAGTAGSNLPLRVDSAKELEAIRTKMGLNGVSAQNALGLNPVIYLPNDQNRQEAIASWLKTMASGNPTLANDSDFKDQAKLNAMAEQLLNSGAIEVKGNSNQLLVNTNQLGLDKTFAQAENMAQGVGFDRRLLLLLLPLAVQRQSTKFLDIIELIPCEQCPGGFEFIGGVATAAGGSKLQVNQAVAGAIAAGVVALNGPNILPENSNQHLPNAKKKEKEISPGK